MTVRKQGRRSAEAAEETKLTIMTAAANMFCELGYERVSLRNISERAGVSHSLIRHHFGSKEKIWHSISDCLESYIHTYMFALLNDIPADCPSNQRLYQFVVRMLAHMIVHPQSIQLIADAVRQEDTLFDYFIDNSGKIEHLVQQQIDAFHHDFPQHQIEMKVLKWQMMIYGHAAASMKPFIADTWAEQTRDLNQCLLNHWELFNQQMATAFVISPDQMLHPDSLEELVLDIACQWVGGW
ncbi:TetR/AcrR family transcriptional regulator [Photobacterium nomapromontoriensis]|uniref:TetR/AcrR family transcriptional regulator n=1 Tax=Photobacterium nomapromontoriensis TaxID=2910237 RepID=UPI003D0A8571